MQILYHLIRPIITIAPIVTVLLRYIRNILIIKLIYFKCDRCFSFYCLLFPHNKLLNLELVNFY